MTVTKTKKEIIHKYVLFIREFFELLNKIIVSNDMNYQSHYLYIGINSLHRVFEHILTKTKNLRKTYFYLQKSQYYYLEYIEQIYKSNGSLNINHTNIVLFIYSKTILNADEKYEENIMDFMEDSPLQFEDEKDLFSKMINIINVLLYWENTRLSFENRNYICETYLPIFLLNYENLDLTHIEIIQEKIKMDDVKYLELLKEVGEMLTSVSTKPHKKKNALTQEEKTEQILTKFYMNETNIVEKFEKEEMSDFVKWVYSCG